MCWCGSNVRHIAEEDMKVQKIFKYFSNKITSPIFKSEWKRGVISPKVYIPIKSFLKDRLIDEGYHCCRQIKIKSDRYCHLSGTILMSKSDFDFTIILTCIIPKGTVYYENKIGEIVCEQLILM